ncbi:MAG: hypothetical protein CM1200mP13_17620 [Candidatus Pelagibacterales bacterium]|nr:MAG: hypothetical protein CM1200mP13_17620 [Pelagibacterales bacterium]
MWGKTRAKRRLSLFQGYLKEEGGGKSEVKKTTPDFFFDIPNELIVGHQVNKNKEKKKSNY